MAAVALVGAPASAIGGSAIPVGYALCSAEGDATGFVWYADDVSLGTTRQRFLVHDGVVYPARVDDCAAAVACLELEPAASGKLATIVGTSAADVLLGTPGPDLIVGGAGDDEIDGRGGGDLVCGEGGDDRLRGGGGPDVLFGGYGDDVMFGEAGADVIFGGDGLDAAFGGGGDDVVRGSAGSDALYGGSGDDLVRGGGGADACFGQAGHDRSTSCRVRRQGSVAYGRAPYVGFEVVVDDGVDVPVELMAGWVDRTLGDARSWVAEGDVGLKRLREGGAMTIILATPSTVDRLCAPLDTGGYYSCRNGRWVAINIDRWQTATSWWTAGLTVYRQYVVNHEVGHFLGHGHVSCPGAGRIAPVMMQQTKGLDGCIANGWPYP